MHALQIDTISVVARSPYLVLWSRIGDFDPAVLDDLLAKHRILEHWSHAACFILIEDYPTYRRMMLDQQRAGAKRWYGWLDEHTDLAERVLQRLREHGPVRSADFERPDGRKGDGWWDWKEEKLALEMLLLRGDVMVARRQSFQRIYDLTERVLPAWDDCQALSSEDALRGLAVASVRALGVGRADWVRDYMRSLSLPIRAVRRCLDALAQDGELIRVDVEGWPADGYVHAENLDLLDHTERVPAKDVTAILSPFDPIVRDRERAHELFGFDYRIECYTPAPKRKYGYFSLPILHGEGLVGRLDAKAHRAAGVFEVKSLHFEPGLNIDCELVNGLRDRLHRLAAWHGTPEVVIRSANLPEMAKTLA